MYAPCARCRDDHPLDKFTPLVELGLELHKEHGRCPSCGKRHLDHVMASALDILIKEGLKDAGAALKDVGTPLVAFGVTMVDAPRLRRKASSWSSIM